MRGFVFFTESDTGLCIGDSSSQPFLMRCFFRYVRCPEYLVPGCRTGLSVLTGAVTRSAASYDGSSSAVAKTEDAKGRVPCSSKGLSQVFGVHSVIGIVFLECLLIEYDKGRDYDFGC
jgi:hypothetical protein